MKKPTKPKGTKKPVVKPLGAPDPEPLPPDPTHPKP